MSALSVVEDLDVFKDLGARSGSRHEGTIADELFLQRREEALGDGVIPAVAFAAHALAHAVTPQPSAKHPARVLAAAVAVEDEPGWRPAQLHGGVQRFADELGS